MKSQFIAKWHVSVFHNKIGKRIVIAGLLLIAKSGAAWAGDCPVTANIVGPATLSVPQSAPPGTVLATFSLDWSALQPNGCKWPQAASANYAFYGEGSPDGNLYPTNIPGIAYRGRLPGWQRYGLDKYWPETGLAVSEGSDGRSGYIKPGSATIELIKTGPVQSGSFGPGTIMRGYVQGVNFFNIFLSNTINVTYANPACSVLSSTVPVNLETVNSLKLNETGKTAGDTLFTLPLNCPSPTRISLTFSGDVVDSGNAVFRNSNPANTANVGVQLLDKNNIPVPTSPASSISLGEVSGNYNYPMTARYYSLTGNVPAGAVSSVAYVTIQYN